jgi:hypothetical protein
MSLIRDWRPVRGLFWWKARSASAAARAIPCVCGLTAAAISILLARAYDLSPRSTEDSRQPRIKDKDGQSAEPLMCSADNGGNAIYDINKCNMRFSC